MRRTISSLMVLGIISGCSSGEGGTKAPADTQAPSVAITGPATIEGGQTAMLAVTVTDNVSTGLTPTLTCTGNGTLTGSSLATTAVTANTTVTCTATATDAAGNVGRGTLTITVQPSTASITVTSGSQQVMAGGMGLVFTSNLTLGQESYEGTIGTTPVRLLRANGTDLIFFLPLGTPTGAQRVNVTIGGRNLGFDVTVAAAPTVGDPRGAVRAALTNAKASINSTLATNTTITAAFRSTLQAQLVKLDEAIVALDAASNADVANVASVMAANGYIATGTAAYDPILPSLSAECQQRLSTFGRNAAITLTSGYLLAGAVNLALGFTVAIPPSALATAIFAGASIGLLTPIFVEYALKLRPSKTAAFAACWTEASYTFNLLGPFEQSQKGNWAPTRATAPKQGFRNNVTLAFQLRRSYEPVAGVRSEVTRLFDNLKAIVTTISIAPAEVRAAVGEFQVTASEVVPSSRVSIASISDGRLRGSITRAGDNFGLNFRLPEPAPGQQDIDFSFTLARAEGEESMIVPASLTFLLPTATDGSIELTQGRAMSSTVTTTGADTLEVVTQPANGNVTLQNNGAYTITPTGQFFGTDSFTYRARNADGVSRTATVAISVIRRFEGLWNITARSTTTSQSSPGLCPNEVNTFSINIAKVSDTQYTTSYQGFPLTLNMATRDDPAGLVGTAAVTYPDDPGQTSENLTARVPNSTQITGSGSFVYTGPNNSRCSGTTSITGVRP